MKKLIPFVFTALVLFPLLGNAQNNPTRKHALSLSAFS